MSRKVTHNGCSREVCQSNRGVCSTLIDFVFHFTYVLAHNTSLDGSVLTSPEKNDVMHYAEVALEKHGLMA